MSGDRMSEPPDGTALYWPAADADMVPVVVVRDDTLATLHGDSGARWFFPNSDYDDPLSWGELVALAESEGDSPADAHRLYPESAIAAAVADAQVVPLGEHLKEPGGWCRTHSVQHSEPDWARIHDQLQAEEEENG